jgi:hypothetical protein
MKKTAGSNKLKESEKSPGYDNKNHISKRDDFEVEYKEFKVAEFLEIRKKPPSSSSGSKGEPDIAERQGDHSPYDLHIRREKRIIFSIIIVLLVLSCLFGAFYLMKYFLH